jgi:hypothetical protein
MNVQEGKFKMDRPGFPKHHFWAGDYLVKVVVKKWDQYFNLREKITEEQYNYVGQSTLKIGNTGEISGYMKAEIPQMMNYYREGEKLLSETEGVLQNKKVKPDKKGDAGKVLERLDKLVHDLMVYQSNAHGNYNKARLRYSIDRFYGVFSALTGELSQELNPPPGGGGQSQGVDIQRAKEGFEKSKEILCNEFFFLQRVEELKLLKEDWVSLLSADLKADEYQRRLKRVKDGVTNIMNAHLEMEKVDESVFNPGPYKKLAEREKGLKYDLEIMQGLVELVEKESRLSGEGKELDEKDRGKLNELLKKLKERLLEEKEKEKKVEEPQPTLPKPETPEKPPALKPVEEPSEEEK